MIVAWLIFPLLLAALALGCGLLLERVAGDRIRSGLVIPAGLATMIVITQVPVAVGLPGLTMPLAVLAALVGYVVSPRWRSGRPDWVMVGTGVAVLAVYAAPIVLSGEATFAGYIKLDDTSTWLAITDQVMERGLDISSLPPSSFEATLDVNLAAGYPFGVFLPLGIGHEVLGTDVAWLFQPFMAFLAVSLALALWALAGEATENRWARAGIAFVAAQPALLFGYYLWGGVKETASAMLLVTAIGLLGPVFAGRTGVRSVIPTAVALAALVSVLTPAGVVWVGPALAIGAVVIWRQAGLPALLTAAVGLVAATVVFSLPTLLTGSLTPAVNDPLTGPDVLGNLIAPLSLGQVVGIWPVGDFRIHPTEQTVTWILIAVAVAAGAYGLVQLIRRRGFTAALYVGGILLGTLGLWQAASPWNGAKALAAGSPIILFAAGVGAAALLGAGRRTWAVVVAVLVAGGVIWSNVLAFHEVRLAPRYQLSELESIGETYAGQGPTLMTEYQTYGDRHFLRKEAPEGAAELRRRLIPLKDGTSLEKGEYADTDRFDLPSLFVYRTLVLRRSPSQSRPPSPYALKESDDYYEVWQRPRSGGGEVIEHMGLGEGLEAGGVPDCARVEAMASRVPVGGELAAATAPPLLFYGLGEQDRPDDWPADIGDPRLIYPESPGRMEFTVDAPAAGEYEVWVGGSVSGRISASVNGEETGAVSHLQNNNGQYIPLGAGELQRGPNTLALEYDERLLVPGSGGPTYPIGPLVLRPVAEPRAVMFLPPSRASELCGRRLDWVEIVG